MGSAVIHQKLFYINIDLLCSTTVQNRENYVHVLLVDSIFFIFKTFKCNIFISNECDIPF